ncbi:pilus assembly protein [Occultella glacieicola]|uniref:Pilus assembly protein n=1 Tax=Occultella glacieicola TaxID=2518684 RepID=A0ABY2E7X2_9MICO|nr:pilus assembly protein [Occultella glacieicola]
MRSRLERSGEAERGSAVVEFLGVSLVLLVPIVYLIITLGRIEAAGFAAEGAARDAGRLISDAETMEEGLALATLAVELAFADQGITVDGDRILTVTCAEDPCLTPGSFIHLRIDTTVSLPGAPAFMADALPMEVAIEAEAMTAVDTYRERP